MWKPGAQTPPKARGGAVARGLGRLARTVAPFLVTWVAGMRPQVRVAWGAQEFHVRRDGIAVVRREGPGFADNPRSNYNDRVRKRQERQADTTGEPPSDGASSDPAPSPKPSLDLSSAALQAAVDAKMGRGSTHQGETSRDPAVIKEQMSALRAALQALDDVKDWDVVQGIDDEMYQLHKAVEYKLRNHKASEAKSKLEDLFK